MKISSFVLVILGVILISLAGQFASAEIDLPSDPNLKIGLESEGSASFSSNAELSTGALTEQMIKILKHDSDERLPSSDIETENPSLSAE